MEFDERQYENNYLHSVIFRLDYSPILLLDEQLKPDFQEAIRQEFPKLDVEMQNVVELKVDFKNKKKSVEIIKTYKVWHFLNKEKSYKINICNNFFSIECFKYKHFEGFAEIAKHVFSTFYLYYKPLDCKRLGLRYINKIIIREGHSLEWSDYIAVPLVYSIENFIGGRSELSRAMSQFTLNRGDYNLIVNFGISNDEYPSRISRKEFILDYDCYTQDVEENSVEEKINKFHAEIQQLFEYSITEKLRNIMEIKHAK